MAVDNVHHGDLASIRHVYKRSAAVRVDLKAFGVGEKPDVRNLRSCGRIDHRKTAAAVADDHVAGPGIDADVIGVIAQRDRAHRSQILRPEHAHAAIPGIGDDHQVRFGRVSNALGLAQSGKATDDARGYKVDNVDGVVPELGDEEPLAPKVYRHVIDAALDAVERNGSLKHERRLSIGGRASCKWDHACRR
ncbi:MAG: hypothetical protein M3Y41_09520 [Pseudomonadota bacterium]|nr:hypothetical protein [Pseudomonadota bacterium]